MTKYYATITNLRTGRQFEIGEYSEAALRKTLDVIHKTGYENLDECRVTVYTAEIEVN